MIYVECISDKTLVATLGISNKEIRHAYGRGNVYNQLKKGRGSKGLVDEDPLSAQSNYIQKLKLLSSENGIKLLYEEGTQNCLIVLCPRLEEWILSAVNEAKIDIASYGLPDEASKLHEIININPRNFEKFLEDFKEKSKMLKTLERFLKGKKVSK